MRLSACSEHLQHTLGNQAPLQEHLVTCRRSSIAHLEREQLFLLVALADSNDDLFRLFGDLNFAPHDCGDSLEPLLAAQALFLCEVLGHMAGNGHLDRMIVSVG